MSQAASSSLRFGDVICLGLECTDDSDTGMFYVLGHQSPLSLVPNCPDVIDHVLVAEMPCTFSATSKKGQTAAFPVPVHSREYWFEIVGKSEYMLQQTHQKLLLQLARLEAQQVQITKDKSWLRSPIPPLHSQPAAAPLAGAGVGSLLPIQALGRPVPGAAPHGRDSDGRDIELSEVTVAFLPDSNRSSHTHMPLPDTSAAVANPALIAASKEIQSLKSRIADIVELASGEAQRNSENDVSRRDTVVRYGDVIQLRHVLTKKFVALANGALSSYELSPGDMNCWFVFEPGFKLSAIGDAINLDAEGKLSVKLMAANSQTEGKVYMSVSAAANDESRDTLTINLALDGVLEPSESIPIRTVSSGNVQNRISIFRAGDRELVARTLEVSGILSGSTIVRFYYREYDSFLAGRRAENHEQPNKPFLIPAANCTTAKIHDFALTLWFLVDGDGNLAGCGDTLALGSIVVLQHVVTGLILIAEQNPNYVKQTPLRRRSGNSRASFDGVSPASDMEKSPVASPEVVAKAKRAWGLTRNAIKAGIAFGDAGKTPSKRISVHHVVEAREPFFKLVLLSMKSIMEAQDSDASMQQQLVTRWQLAPPNNKTSGSSSDEISNKSVFLLKSCDCDKIISTEQHMDHVPNVIIGAEHASVSKEQLPVMGAVMDCADDKLPEHLFNVEFISPRMLEFVEKPRSVVFILHTFFVELQSFTSEGKFNELCSFIDKFGQRVKMGFELFARLCCSNAKDEISAVSVERLIYDVPNRKMQLLFGQLGAVSLIGSLIQNLQFIWKGGDSVGSVPSYPADVSQILEDIVSAALTAFVCLCSGSPENKKIVSPDMLELLSEKLLPVQTLSDTVVRVMVALSAENQPVVLKLNKNKNSSLLKILCLLQQQRRSTFVDFLTSFLFVNGQPLTEYQRILLHTVFTPDAATIAAGCPQNSFFPRVVFLPWKYIPKDKPLEPLSRLSCHIIMEHIADWGFWPLKDGKTNLIEVLWSMKPKNPLPSKISLGKYESENDIMTFQFATELDPKAKSEQDIQKMEPHELKSLVNALCILRIQYLCSLYSLVSCLCYGRNAYCRDFFRVAYNYSIGVIGEHSDSSVAPDMSVAESIIPNFDTLLLGVVEDNMPAAFKSACVQLLHTLYVSNDPWMEQDILPAIVVDTCFPLTDPRDQTTMMPANTHVSAISFDRITFHLNGTSDVALDHDRRVMSFQASIAVEFPLNFSELNGHQYFECQVPDDPALVLNFAIGFAFRYADGDGTQTQTSTNKLIWNSKGSIFGVTSKCKDLRRASIDVETTRRQLPAGTPPPVFASVDVKAPIICHGDIVGCGISALNQFFFTLNQRVFFLYKDESMPTLREDFASFVSPYISAAEVPFSIIIRDIAVTPPSTPPELQSRSRSQSVATYVQSPQHSIISFTISKVLLPQGQKMKSERSRIEKLLEEVQIPLCENDILEQLFTPSGEDAKLMMKSLCKLIESSLRLQIDDSDKAYVTIVKLMKSCVAIFEYLYTTFFQKAYPTLDKQDKDREDARREGSDDEDDSGSDTPPNVTAPGEQMSEDEWKEIFEKGSSTEVLLYACSLLSTLLDLLVKRRIQVFSNYVQDQTDSAISLDASDLLKMVAKDETLKAANVHLRHLEKYLHIACRCPDDVVKSVVLKVLFEHQSFQAGFIRSLIPIIHIHIPTVLYAGNSVSLSDAQCSVANIARSLERVAKQIRLSESNVRSFLADPVFEVRFMEPLLQLWSATEDLISLILPRKEYFDSLHASLINDIESPCQVLFDLASISNWTASQGSSFAATPSSANIILHHMLKTTNVRISLDSVLKKDTQAHAREEMLHLVGAMFVAAEVDQAIISLLDIRVVPIGQNGDAVKQRGSLVAVSIVESIFLRLMDALCAATKLSQDCQNGIASHVAKLRALVASDDSVENSFETKVVHRSRLPSGAAKVWCRLLHENTSFAASLSSEDVTVLSKTSFANPDHFIIGITHSMLFQRDFKSQKVQHFSSNQSSVFSLMMEVLLVNKQEFLLVEQNASPPSDILQKCFDRDSVHADALRNTRCNPNFLLHMDVIRLMSACVRGNTFTKASIMPIISLSNAFTALALLLSKRTAPASSMASLVMQAERPADVQLNVAIEWASSAIVYYCELIGHAHLISSHQNSLPVRRDDIPFATKNGLVPVLGAFVTAATRLIQPLTLDASVFRDFNGSVESLMSLFSSISYLFAGAHTFMSLVAGKIADHCLKKSSSALIPMKFEDFSRIMKQFEKTEENDKITSQFKILTAKESDIRTLRSWGNGHKVFYSLSSATLLFLMTKFHTELSSFTPGQLNLAFSEIVSSLLWVQRASVQILPSFLSLYSSSYLPPLHDENRQIIVDFGQKLAALDRAYKFTNAGNEDSGYGLCFIRDNILKRTVSLFSKDSVHSWLAPKRHAKIEILSSIDDSDVAAIFENPEFFDKNLPIKSYMQLQHTFLHETCHKKSSARIGRRRSAQPVDFVSGNSPWTVCVSKLSIGSKLSVTDVSDCISDGRFDIAYALAKSALLSSNSEAQQLERLEDEDEVNSSLHENESRGCYVRVQDWCKSILEYWRLFTISFSKWILDLTIGIAMFGYRIVARVADLLGVKELLLLSSAEKFLKKIEESKLETRRFLDMDSKYKSILFKVNRYDDKDPNMQAAIAFSDASPPALVHSLIKSISVMDSAKALIGLRDPEREAVIDQFFLQALDVLRLHIYTAPCMTKGEAKMRAHAFNFKIPIVVPTSSSSWILRLNLVQNHLALGNAVATPVGADEAAKSAAGSDAISSHQELLSALISLSLSTSPTPSIRVAATECLSCLLCGCSHKILEAFGCHSLVESPANSFFLSLAEAFETFRKSAYSRAIDLQKFSDIYEAVASGSNVAQQHDDNFGDHSINPKFLILLKAEVQRRLSFDAPPPEASNSVFSFVAEGIAFISTFIMGASDEAGEEVDTTEAPVFVRILLKFIPVTRLRGLFQRLLSRMSQTHQFGDGAADIDRSLKEIAVIASKRILSSEFELFVACNSLIRNLLVSSSTFTANVSFQELLISQEKHADPANIVDVSSSMLDLIIQSLDAIQSGAPDMFDPYIIVSCYVNLQKLCFGQNRKVVQALSENSFLSVYNRTITVMLSIVSFLNKNHKHTDTHTLNSPIFLDGFHPLDIILSLVLLLRNLCTSDTDNLICPKIFAGISWSNMFKLTDKIAEFYNLKQKSEGFSFSMTSLAHIRSAARDLFSNLLPNSESNSDLRRQVQMAQEVLTGVFALKETLAYHSPKESTVSTTLTKLFVENCLHELPIFSGNESHVCRIEVVRREGKAELMFFQKPDELRGIGEIDAGDLMPIRDSHGESLRSHIVEAERMRLSVIARQAFGAKFFRKFDYVPLAIGSLINMLLILFLALKVNDGEHFDLDVRHPKWQIPLQLNWNNFADVISWQGCEDCKLDENPLAKIVPNIFTQFKDGGGGDTFVGSECDQFDPLHNATQYNNCFKFEYSESTQFNAAVAIGATFLLLAFANIVATGSNLLSWIYYSSQFVVRETVLNRWYRECKDSGKPMFFTELEAKFTNADSFKIIIRNVTFWWLILKCAAALLTLFVHPILSVFFTFDAFRIKQVDYIFSAFTVKGKEFITLFLLISAIIYLNAVFGIVFYWDQMKNWSLQCSSLFQCTVSFFIVGWTGSIGDLMDAPEDDLGYPKYADFRGAPSVEDGDGRLMFRLIWQLAFFIVVPTCLISVVTGIIIDSFNEMRQSINERREKLENSCFVCDISSDVWRKVALDLSTRQGAESLNFGTHVMCEHNILDYFYIFFRVRSARSFAHFTDQEHDLRRRFNQLDFTVFPMDQALTLVRAADRLEESNVPNSDDTGSGSHDSTKLAALEEAIKQLSDKLTQQMALLQPPPMVSAPLNAVAEE